MESTKNIDLENRLEFQSRVSFLISQKFYHFPCGIIMRFQHNVWKAPDTFLPLNER